MKRKWEWIYDEIPNEVDDKKVAAELQVMAKQIDDAMVKAYPHAPTTKEWEDDYDDLHNEVTKYGLIDVVTNGCYCIGCEITESVQLFEFGKENAEEVCTFYCRFGKIMGACTDEASPTVYDQFVDKLRMYDAERFS